jgi:meiotic recombination protein SPO11
LKKIKNELNLPVHALFDCDSGGLRILSVYMFGSKKMSYDSFHLTTEGIQWLGVRPTDLDTYNIGNEYRFPTTQADIKRLVDFKNEEFVTMSSRWKVELDTMDQNRKKVDIQFGGFSHVGDVYLPSKLEQHDWLEWPCYQNCRG